MNLSQEKEVTNHKVVVFSKSYCPYCKRVKDAFASKNVPISVCELDEASNGDAIQSTLATITGLKTVPNVWIGGEFVGDSSKTIQRLNAGDFNSVLGIGKL
jgi:glutaredoxin 3